MGAALVCMEMVSAKAIYYNNKNTDSLMEIHPEEVPASLQLFGSDPQILAEMAKTDRGTSFSILDLNMGCPVPKVVNNGEGSALMKDPKLVEQILTALGKGHQQTGDGKDPQGALMMTMSMPWRSRRSRKPAVWRQWRCTDGPEPSTTADRQTGILSHR